MSEITCLKPECDAPAEEIIIFSEKWIQCEKGHKTVVNDSLLPLRDGDKFILEESSRRL